MFPEAMMLQIKDLKDLRILFGQGYYRHAGPKGPEEMFSYAGTIAGDRPPRYGGKRAVYRRARACPSPCYRVHERSRGTGPRATVDEAAARLTRSGAGAPELRSPAPNPVKS